MSQKRIKTIQLISLLLIVSFMMAESFRKRGSTVALSKVTTISEYFGVVMFYECNFLTMSNNQLTFYFDSYRTSAR